MINDQKTDPAGSQDTSKTSGVRKGGVVELRSDAAVAGGGKVKSSGFSKRGLWIAGGIILLLLVVGAAVALALPGRQVTSDGEGKKFSLLPQSDNRERGPVTESGLSGRECDDAGRRAVGVMLSSDVVTRPVSGFASADMVFELPVLVSDVTRLLALYQCGRPEDIGSVRSARHDYLFLAEGVDAILGHWGGSYHALNRIDVGEFQTINALGNPYNSFFRKTHLPAPYNGFTSYEGLWNALQKLGYRTESEFEGYEFKDDVDPSQRPTGGTLSVAWPGAYAVRYEYDPETNRYVRYWGGEKQIDGGTKETVAPSSVVVVRATNQFAEGPGGYNDVGIEGEGDVTVYQDGTFITGRWKKDERYKNDPMHFLDENGDPIVLTRGQVWVMAVEPTVNVVWEPAEAAASATP